MQHGDALDPCLEEVKKLSERLEIVFESYAKDVKMVRTQDYTFAILLWPKMRFEIRMFDKYSLNFNRTALRKLNTLVEFLEDANWRPIDLKS